MILVICGTNRPNSRTSLVSKYIVDELMANGEDVAFGSLEDLAPYLIHENMYDGQLMKKELVDFQDTCFTPANKLIIVSPEYNGSFPGMLKLLFDCLSIRNYAETFKGKKALLVGVASGRAGNLRGLEQLTGFLNYLKINVFPNKLPISSIEGVLNNDELDASTQETVNSLLAEYVKF